LGEGGSEGEEGGRGVGRLGSIATGEEL